MASLFRRSNGIYYLVTIVNGKQVWRSTGCKTKAQALKWLSGSEQQIPFEEPIPTGILLSEFRTQFLQYAKSNLSPKTVDLYRSGFSQFLKIVGDRPLSGYSVRDVETFKIERLKTVSPVKVNIDFRTLRASFNIAVNWELVQVNPFLKVKEVRIPPKRPVYFTQEEFKKLLGTINQEWYRDIVRFAVSTMMRVGEIVNLRWSKVDLPNRLIHVENTIEFTVKTQRPRTIPMDEWVCLMLRKKARISELVFTFPSGRPLPIGYVSHRLKKWVRRAGLREELHFHSLRHTGATWLVQKDVPIFTVQQLLGHSRVDMTQIYSHLDVEHLRKPLQKIQDSIERSDSRGGLE